MIKQQNKIDKKIGIFLAKLTLFIIVLFYIYNLQSVDDINRVCFSPDGHYLVTMSSVNNEENLARIWCNPHGLQIELVMVERQLHGEKESYIRERLSKRVDEIKCVKVLVIQSGSFIMNIQGTKIVFIIERFHNKQT